MTWLVQQQGLGEQLRLANEIWRCDLGLQEQCPSPLPPPPLLQRTMAEGRQEQQLSALYA